MGDPVWLVSVHDVMPETLTAVKEIVSRLDEFQVSPLTLLVVPGVDWQDSDIAWLRDRQMRGDQLAGHGWRHQAGPVRGLYDRFHRKSFSRGVAEHLALNSDEIEQLIAECYDWFIDKGLRAPKVYVPPAWAMGRISRHRLRKELPFRLYETLTGIYDTQVNRFRRLPLIGFEADTTTRAVVLRGSNAVNRAMARLTGKLRVSIHPNDLELRLHKDLVNLITHPASCQPYADDVVH